MFAFMNFGLIPRIKKENQLKFSFSEKATKMCAIVLISVMRVGGDTFGDPIFSKGLFGPK